jgi:hypothetical protein
MTVTLNLPPQVEQAHLAEAQARGLPLDEVVREVLVAARPTASAAELGRDESMRAFKAWAHSHDHDNLPVLSDYAVSRDSMYD